MNNIKTGSQLKGGTFYIRAVVNYLGQHWIETLRIAGRPFNTTCKSPYLSGSKKIKVFGRYVNEGYYLSDLGVGGGRTKLYPFSNKLFLKLQELSKDQRSFMEYLKGRQFSDQEWSNMLLDWAFEKQMDSIRDEMMNDMIRDEPWGDDDQ